MYSRIRPYIHICRVSNMPTVWTNVLAAMVLTQAPAPWPAYFPIALSLSLFYAAGMCLNDAMDLTVDRIRKPFRPIPSGAISIAGAYTFSFALLFGALLLLLMVPFGRAVYPGLALAALIVWYDKYHKENPWSILLMAGCRFMVFIITSVALSGTVNSLVFAAGGLQFAYVLLVSAVSRFENGLGKPFAVPAVPVMIAGISVLDGAVMAVLASGYWLIAGLAGGAMTLAGQRYVRGD
jgi:4-hydroxybenzoate polyprenyltransferase